MASIYTVPFFFCKLIHLVLRLQNLGVVSCIPFKYAALTSRCVSPQCFQVAMVTNTLTVLHLTVGEIVSWSSRPCHCWNPRATVRASPWAALLFHQLLFGSEHLFGCDQLLSWVRGISVQVPLAMSESFIAALQRGSSWKSIGPVTKCNPSSIAAFLLVWRRFWLARRCWALVSAALRVVVRLHVAEASIGASRCGDGLISSASSCLWGKSTSWCCISSCSGVLCVIREHRSDSLGGGSEKRIRHGSFVKSDVHCYTFHVMTFLQKSSRRRRTQHPLPKKANSLWNSLKVFMKTWISWIVALIEGERKNVNNFCHCWSLHLHA